MLGALSAGQCGKGQAAGLQPKDKLKPMLRLARPNT
jgi:hypothetical protein